MADCAAVPGLFSASIVHPFADARPKPRRLFRAAAARRRSGARSTRRGRFFSMFPYRYAIAGAVLRLRPMPLDQSMLESHNSTGSSSRWPTSGGADDRAAQPRPGYSAAARLSADMRLPSAVKHLKVLEEGGIVVSRKAGRIRTYTMRARRLRPVTTGRSARGGAQCSVRPPDAGPIADDARETANDTIVCHTTFVIKRALPAGPQHCFPLLLGEGA